MAGDKKPDRGYEIGRGKPPKRTQFQKGQSGNAKGRPKGSKNFKTTIHTELKRKVTINEDGRRRRITKREAVAKQLVNKAASGDPKVIPILLKVESSGESDAAEGRCGAEDFPMMAEDDLVLANIIKRIRESSGPQSETLAQPTSEPSQLPSESTNEEVDGSIGSNAENDDADDAS